MILHCTHICYCNPNLYTHENHDLLTAQMYQNTIHQKNKCAPIYSSKPPFGLVVSFSFQLGLVVSCSVEASLKIGARYFQWYKKFAQRHLPKSGSPGGDCAQCVHSTHSVHFTGRNWRILGQLAIILPVSVNSCCIAKFVGLAMYAVLRDALVDMC